MFNRSEPLLAPLQRARAQGLDLMVLAHVQSHAAWAREAYVEWALQHKHYPGRLRSFEQWAEQRMPLFAPALARHDRAFPGCLTVRNADACDDPVQDVWQLAGLADLPFERAAAIRAQAGTELFLRALFNDRPERDASPAAFAEAIGRMLPQAVSPTAFLQALYPGPQDIDHVVRDAEGDRLAVDTMLVQQGQPPLFTGATPPKSPSIDEDLLLGALAQLCIANARRLEALEVAHRQPSTGATAR
ncbi:MAG TPA: hypothetical protein VLA61_19590 [Ideonella sp.]|uniref:hypothetical protein n=1 Tax=Ideonella sp. TaxID=1929293 RepID=UPI002BB186DE|nr:hypothetical protein [Ideonella sp.]HSI50475.1 hypothetical protein [Ideonella sp.]